MTLTCVVGTTRSSCRLNPPPAFFSTRAVDLLVTPGNYLSRVTRFLLIPVSDSLPVVRGFLTGVSGHSPHGSDVTRAAADLLERCIKTCEVLVTFAVCVAGRPSMQ
jgi:hypothetical protein